MNTLVALHLETSSTFVAVSAMLVGVLTPAVVAVVNHPIFEPQTKRLIALGCAVLLGILTVIGNGLLSDFDVTVASVVTIVLAVIGASQAAYALVWKPTGASDVIEEKVNPGPTVPELPPFIPKPVPDPVEPPVSPPEPPVDTATGADTQTPPEEPTEPSSEPDPFIEGTERP